MKVKVCKKCSKLDIDKLEDLSNKYGFKLKKTCLGHCKEKKKDYFFGELLLWSPDFFYRSFYESQSMQKVFKA